MRLPALIAVALLLVSCSPPAASPSPSSAGTSAEPSAAVSGFPSTCHDLDLRSPNGDEVDLSGTWLGNEDAYWLFTQVGDCVWATALDNYTTPNNPDAYWQIYLRGTLRSDFTIAVEYAYSSLGTILGPHYGHAVLAIAFGADGSTDSMTLTKIVGCGGGEGDTCPAGEGTLQTTEWTLASSTVILPPPSPGS